MKIDNIGGQGRPESLDAPGNQEKSSKPGNPEPVRDRVEVSDSARQLAGLSKAAKELPEIRQERITEVRKAIEDGTYRVDTRRLARAILEFEDGLRR